MAVSLLVFAVTMGPGIIVIFALSAIRGRPYSLPAAAIIGAIMLPGTLVARLFLRGVREEQAGAVSEPGAPPPSRETARSGDRPHSERLSRPEEHS